MTQLSKSTMEDNIALHVGFCYCAVCSAQSEAKALEWLKLNVPVGTNLWRKDNVPHRIPLQCSDYRNRKHYFFSY